MIHLLKPNPGAVQVDPQTEILISFQDIPDENWKDQVNVDINGRMAIRDGTIHPDFETTRCNRSHQTGRWGIRPNDPLPEQDIMVQASCAGDCSENQRFFVRGSSTNYSPNRPAYTVRKKTWHTAGWFWIHKEGWKTPFQSIEAPVYPSRVVPVAGRTWMAIYPKRGILQYIQDGDIQEESFQPVEEDADVDCIYGDRGWLLVANDSNGVHTFGDDHECHWGFQADDVCIEEMIHAKVGTLSFHLPLFYDPAIGENTLESWYMMSQHLEESEIAFKNDLCVVWNEDQMIARHDFDPLLGESDDMLWESDDIDAPFKDVRILNSNHVLVNDNIYLNTRYPKIYPA